MLKKSYRASLRNRCDSQLDRGSGLQNGLWLPTLPYKELLRLTSSPYKSVCWLLKHQEISVYG